MTWLKVLLAFKALEELAFRIEGLPANLAAGYYGGCVHYRLNRCAGRECADDRG